jgi:mono/diheme cytochrome c family protein
MRSSVNVFLPALLALSLFSGVEGTATPQQPQPARPKKNNLQPATTSSEVDEAAEGAKRFETHCGRCHQPPQDLSPREARAVMRHMRTRAMLSAEDERLILKFIAP